MLIIFVLMLVLLQIGSCVDQNCTFNQTETCYAALGDKLSLRMFQDIPIVKLELKKEETLIYKVVNNRIFKFDFYYKRSDITLSDGNNDTVIIKSVTRADSGRYTLTLTDSQGKATSTPELQVNVEAPIGSVKVSVECISGVWLASCSSEGDSLFFSWTLNGKPLAQEYKTTINLDGKTSGNLICSVKNHISHGEKSITVNYCTGSVSLSFVIVWTLQMVFLLLLLGGFHIYIRKRTNTQTPGEKKQEDIVLYENLNKVTE
ncbi:uncharacterized protein [Paramisgurnus dabryanus]|uniref:uncharacterized protein n=1 Tax=Paramisgurnus dabryanus TaxID=90735 RepID=UPI003CCF23B6